MQLCDDMYVQYHYRQVGCHDSSPLATTTKVTCCIIMMTSLDWRAATSQRSRATGVIFMSVCLSVSHTSLCALWVRS